MDKEINSNGFEYVDLGLPSGTLWATMNVGATKPSDAGLYFQWGNTIGYSKNQVGKDKQFTWDDYKWNPSGDGETFKKYANNRTILDLEDDAAHVHMGGDWHMPTIEQIQELIDNTGCGRVMMERIGGTILTSINDKSKSIRIPAVGGASDGSVVSLGNYGVIWSSMLSLYDFRYGKCLILGSEGAHTYVNSRYVGLSIRGVIG